ncbi:MAG: hypothetical protein IPM97_08665 [Bdellovibrionaceae bacterium]|nr:hypothetical protein [Pseudobdellovibrionaceae bacterium]
MSLLLSGRWSPTGQTFVQEQKKVGKVPPLFIQDEVTKFLECGSTSRIWIYSDLTAIIVGTQVLCHFLAKKGFCPSCCAKRMNNEAAHLVDVVLPEIPCIGGVLVVSWLNFAF